MVCRVIFGLFSPIVCVWIYGARLQQILGAVCGICRMYFCIWCVGMFVLGSFWFGPAVGDVLETKFVNGVHQLCCLRM